MSTVLVHAGTFLDPRPEPENEVNADIQRSIKSFVINGHSAPIALFFAADTRIFTSVTCEALKHLIGFDHSIKVLDRCIYRGSMDK